jgi:NAD-dependent dihydropyrimidine dehydrogenase PreA subunit
MKSTLVRKIIRIDEERCDGCGECVPSCAEGALRIVDGKARLVSETFCDGLGACLGRCPTGALTVEERPAEAFDAEAVERALKQASAPAPVSAGCPGSRFRAILDPGVDRTEAVPPSKPLEGRAPSRPSPSRPSGERPGGRGASRLSHWPVQLALLPPVGPLWDGADVLIAADCVPFAFPDFHESLLAGRSLAIACPKLDDVRPYLEKLTAIFSRNRVRSVTVAHMEVPCCSGIVRVVEEAIARSGRTDIPLTDVTVSVDGRRIDRA